MKRIGFFFLFLILNALALFLGGLFTKTGVSSSWYQSLNKAPWNPPGWVFGMAWTTVMLCFSIYLAEWFSNKAHRIKILVLFSLQWILNVAWNPLFFYYKLPIVALIEIILLLLLIIYLLFSNRKSLRGRTVLIMPYALWLIVATSLNAYIVLHLK